MIDLNSITKYFKGSFKTKLSSLNSLHKIKIYRTHPSNGATDEGEYIDIDTIINDVYSRIALISTVEYTTTHTLILSDAYKKINMNSSDATILYVPLNSSVPFPVGTQIFIEQHGTGAVAIGTIPGVQIRSYFSYGTLSGQYAVAQLLKVAEDEWTLFGNLQ